MYRYGIDPTKCTYLGNGSVSILFFDGILSPQAHSSGASRIKDLLVQKYPNTGILYIPTDAAISKIEYKVLTDEYSDGKVELADSLLCIGYSLGARSAYAFYMHYPHRVRQMIGISPEFIRPSVMFTFLTQHKMGKALLNYWVQHPTIAVKLIRFFLRQIDPAFISIYEALQSSDTYRQYWYTSWKNIGVVLLYPVIDSNNPNKCLMVYAQTERWIRKPKKKDCLRWQIQVVEEPDTQHTNIARVWLQKNSLK
ncbi:MAG: hypothetical protein MUE33_02755 [Cytophagaceae bacterium]|jgi:hypothetical protein|nr:hypothetical protein [Cytophagaceae bacterium]